MRLSQPSTGALATRFRLSDTIVRRQSRAELADPLVLSRRVTVALAIAYAGTGETAVNNVMRPSDGHGPVPRSLTWGSVADDPFGSRSGAFTMRFPTSPVGGTSGYRTIADRFVGTGAGPVVGGPSIPIHMAADGAGLAPGCIGRGPIRPAMDFAYPLVRGMADDRQSPSSRRRAPLGTSPRWLVIVDRGPRRSPHGQAGTPSTRRRQRACDERRRLLGHRPRRLPTSRWLPRALISTPCSRPSTAEAVSHDRGHPVTEGVSGTFAALANHPSAHVALRCHPAATRGPRFWSARDLMPRSGYGADWRNFHSAIERARATCSNSGGDPVANFRWRHQSCS